MIKFAQILSISILSFLLSCKNHEVTKAPTFFGECSKETCSEAEIKRLINQLASKNKQPTDNYSRFGRSKEWRSAQYIVSMAKKDLFEYGKCIFPFLVESFNDKRFSELQSMVIDFPVSVGDVCKQIIKDKVNVVSSLYKRRQGADNKYHRWPDYFRQKYKNVHSWWEQNKEKSLREMRIDCLQWRINEEIRIGGNSVYLNKLRNALEKVKKSK